MAINVNGFGNKLSGIGLNQAISQVSSAGDCFKDIDNLVLDNVQGQVLKAISDIPAAKDLTKILLRCKK